MQYLFLGIPNFCGSTLIHNILSTSPNVAKLTIPLIEQVTEDFVEGNICAKQGYHNLLGPHSIEANMEHVYSDPNNYDWDLIKFIWDYNWNKYYPNAKIRLQKTPADIFRIPMIMQYFPKTKWLISIRDPYTYAESIYRKATWSMDREKQFDQICYHVMRVMELQLANKAYLKENAYTFRYEDFVSDPSAHISKFIEFIPELESIDLESPLNIKGNTYTKITDHGEPHLEKLLVDYPDFIDKANQHFKPFEYLINEWGYELR